MKKLLLMLMLLVSTITANAKCDFSTVKLQQWNQGTYYKWYLSGWERDTCKGFMFMVYDFQKKKTDTLIDSRGIVEVGFNAPGEYKLYVKVWDKCNKCDTVMYRPVKIIAWKPTAKLSSIKKTCDSAWFEMSSFNLKDTCWTYYYYVYQGPELDSISDFDWANMSDYQLYMYYSFNDKDMELYKETRLLKYKFPRDGKYLIIGQYYNKCLGQDTVFFSRYNIKCKTTNVKTIVKNADPQVIGYYDMLGRQVDYMRPNEVYIVIYSNGQRKKVMQVQN